MGHIRQSATLVCSMFHPDELVKAHTEALRLFPPTEHTSRVSEILIAPLNGVRSFMVSTSGSQVGKPDQELDAAAREKFVNYLKQRTGHLDFVDLTYGDDNMEVYVENQSESGPPVDINTHSDDLSIKELQLPPYG